VYQSVEYIVRNRIPGDIVECGVWSAGSMLLAAHALMHFGDTSRPIYLSDTFAGLPKPDAIGARWDGVPALPTWEHHQRNGGRWGYGGTPDHVGRVWCRRPVIPRRSSCSSKAWQRTPALRHGRKKISLLRLDTDLYSSTYHKLVHLYPLLAVGGILIIDDYGAFQGARLATDRFIEENRLAVFLSRIDPSVRLAIKPQW
jgi:O-methyltransferase